MDVKSTSVFATVFAMDLGIVLAPLSIRPHVREAVAVAVAVAIPATFSHLIASNAVIGEIEIKMMASAVQPTIRCRIPLHNC